MSNPHNPVHFETHDLFPLKVVQGSSPIDAKNLIALATTLTQWSEQNNPARQPWSRLQERNLWEADFVHPASVWIPALIELAYGVKTVSLSAKEVLLYPGQALPAHAESADLSLIWWIQAELAPDPKLQTHDGCLALVNPSGAFGLRELPWEENRTRFFVPRSGRFVVFPGYCTHFSFPLRSQKPIVALHFEIAVDRSQGRVSNTHPYVTSRSF